MSIDKRYEYKIQILEVHLNPILTLARWKVTDENGKSYKEFSDITNFINHLGEEGWELVSAVAGSDHQGAITKVLLFFKREKKDAV